jgi:hypothetical protein
VHVCALFKQITDEIVVSIDNGHVENGFPCVHAFGFEFAYVFLERGGHAVPNLQVAYIWNVNVLLGPERANA